MSDVLTDVLAKRKDRAIAIILSLKEREIDPVLLKHPRGQELSTKLRKIVLDQVNELHSLYADVARSLDSGDGVVLNEHFLNLIAELHDAVVVKGSNGNGSRD